MLIICSVCKKEKEEYIPESYTCFKCHNRKKIHSKHRKLSLIEQRFYYNNPDVYIPCYTIYDYQSL